jgi:hypothetical protein
LKKRNRLLEQETKSCGGWRRSRPRVAPKMRYPLVVDLADDGIPVGDLPDARLLQASLLHVEEEPHQRPDWADADLINAAYDIHADDPTFGYRFIADEQPPKASAPRRTASPDCAASNGSGRRTPRSAG